MRSRKEEKGRPMKPTYEEPLRPKKPNSTSEKRNLGERDKKKKKK